MNTMEKTIRDTEECPYCGVELTETNANVDYMIPVSRQLEEIPYRNTISCCRLCNVKKKNLLPLEFFMGCQVQHHPEFKIIPFSL